MGVDKFWEKLQRIAEAREPGAEAVIGVATNAFLQAADGEETLIVGNDMDVIIRLAGEVRDAIESDDDLDPDDVDAETGTQGQKYLVLVPYLLDGPEVFQFAVEAPCYSTALEAAVGKLEHDKAWLRHVLDLRADDTHPLLRGEHGSLTLVPQGS